MNPMILSRVSHLTDIQLVEQCKCLVKREREATASLIIHLAELDRRRLYFREGCSSMFTYCTKVLQLSEYAAYARIEAARLATKFPIVIDMLEDGSVNLTTVGLLAPHLTQKNHMEVLEEARHKSKREVEELRARLHPQPAVPSSIRRLPTASRLASILTQQDTVVSSQPVSKQQPTECSVLSYPFTPAQPRPAVIVPLAPERYKVQFTASSEMYQKLRLAQNLLRHEIPNGDPVAIFDRALTTLVEALTKKKFAVTDRPLKSRKHPPGSRHIPADVKRAVLLRDGGRCAFVGRDGRRCVEDGFLEFHHVTPYAVGGQATVDNIQLRCRGHNGYEAELDFGSRKH